MLSRSVHKKTKYSCRYFLFLFSDKMTGFTPKVNFDILLIFSSLGLSENEKKIALLLALSFKYVRIPIKFISLVF